MLKYNDIFQWQGFGIEQVLGHQLQPGPPKDPNPCEPLLNWTSQCQRCIYEMEDKFVVIFSESRSLQNERVCGVKNEGTSITNSIEHIATLTIREFPELNRNKPVVWVEHYTGAPNPDSDEVLGDGKETFDLVVFCLWDAQEQRFRQPQWTHTTRKKVEVLLHEPIQE